MLIVTFPILDSISKQSNYRLCYILHVMSEQVLPSSNEQLFLIKLFLSALEILVSISYYCTIFASAAYIWTTCATFETKERLHYYSWVELCFCCTQLNSCISKLTCASLFIWHDCARENTKPQLYQSINQSVFSLISQQHHCYSMTEKLRLWALLQALKFLIWEI